MASSTVPTTTNTTTRRMLFLHGQFLPPECYREKLAVNFIQAFESSGWEFVTVTSPRPCPDTPPDVVKTMFPSLEISPEWINAHSRKDGTKTCDGLQESLQFLQHYLKEQDRFDVICGHSNGALMTSILSLYMETFPNFIPNEKIPSALVIMNAPASYETEQTLSDIVKQHDESDTTRIPSIHVWGGKSDMTWKGQQALHKVHHPNGIVIQHEQGHFLPESQPETYDQIRNALNEIITMKMREA